MTIFGEVKVPCEYMSDEVFTQDYLRQRVADELAKELLESNLIEFTEEYKQGYYIMRGEVELDI